MNFRRAERGFLNSWVTRVKSPEKLFAHIKDRNSTGPWLVSVYTPKDRKLIGRRYFGAGEETSMLQWLLQVQLLHEFVQWFVVSGKDAKFRHADVAAVHQVETARRIN